ncbi:MFS transporter [Kitasatospora mediocidica]|uniref:MFS transporter n=1 Tax=Kitasatospora mediocidica TaxID=58352 RepID=UPI00069045C5|nr:MFS transporter [Kitasatospora mediocidica]
MATQTLPQAAPDRRRFAHGFRRLWSATTLSGLGDGVRLTAFAVFAAALTSDPFQVALVTVAAKLPWLCIGPFTGTLADSIDRWRALWICDAVRTLIIGVFALLAFTGQASIPVLAVTAFVLTSVETLAENIAQAVVPDVVGTASLDTANSRLMGGQFATTEFIGAPLGAFLFGISHALPFTLDSVSFALSAGLILTIRRSRPATPGDLAEPSAPVERMTPRRLREQTAEGARWLYRHRGLRTLCLLIGTLNFSVVAVLGIDVLYALKVLHIGRTGYGLMMVAIAVGGLAGLLVAPRIVERAGRGRTLHLAFLLCPAAFLTAAFTRNPYLASAALSLVGASIALTNVVTASLRQTIIPTGLFGRVNGAYRMIINGLSPLGGLVGGVVATSFGLTAPFLMSAALMTTAAVAALVLLPPDGLDGTTSDTGAGPGRGAGTTARRSKRRAAQALLVGAALLAASAAAYTTVRAPGPLPADAPSGDFSAVRAHRYLSELVTAPHAVGTAEHDRVRDRIVGELTALGLHPQLESATATATGSGAAAAARVQNISATLPGTDPTGRIMIVAHYDSVEIGPGATDDGIGVSSILETVRALKSGPAPRNDVTFLLTDGEEADLMGSRAFTAAGTAENPTDPAHTVVLNLEARGTSGRAVMFETGAHNGALVPTLADHTPVATSFSYEVYRLLANDTDFTIFRRAGMTGMNFAVIGGASNYHTPQDSLANASQSSLQDMGSSVLAAARQLAGADLADLTAQSDSTYFTLWGVLLHYPTGLVVPLAALITLAFLAAGWFARRRGALRVRAALVTAATLPLPLLGAAAVGLAGWQLLTVVRPDYLGFMLGDPYRPALAEIGLGVVAAALIWGWAAALRRHRRTRNGTAAGSGYGVVELSAGVTGVLVLLALLTAVVFPGASYMFVWPALAGSAGLAVAAALPAGSPWRGACASLAAVPVAALLTPVVIMLFATVGLIYAAIPLLVAALLAAPVLVPAAPVLRGRRVLAVVCALTALGTATVVTGTVRDRTDAAHPVQVSLMYALDADTGQARWVSDGRVANPWVHRYVSGDPVGLKGEFPALLGTDSWQVGPAPATTVPLPTLQVAADQRQDGVRTVTVHLGSQFGLPTQLMLYVDTDGATVESARYGTTELAGGHNRPTALNQWKWGFIAVAPGPDGVDLTLRVRADGPLRLRMVAQTPTLPDPALRTPRPATVNWSGDSAGYTVATRAFTV